MHDGVAGSRVQELYVGLRGCERAGGSAQVVLRMSHRRNLCNFDDTSMRPQFQL